jgi:hypothetical protein
MMLGLRLAEGVDDARFHTRFGMELRKPLGKNWPIFRT